MTTKLIDQYMKMVAIPYLQRTIKDVVMKIMECKQSCEVIDNINVMWVSLYFQVKVVSKTVTLKINGL